MNRQAYNKLQYEAKQRLNEVIKRFAEQNPERFAELQAQAKREFNQPTPPRTITRTQSGASTYVHTRDYFIHTKDCFGKEHLYFHALNNESPKEVLERYHPKFTERNEKVTKVEPCQCPLCTAL